MELSKFTLPATLLVAMPSCSSLPGFEDPQFAVHPVFTLYKVEGRVGTPSPLIQVSDLGLGDPESDFGTGATYGDGFSGLKFDALIMDQKPRKTELIPGNYGPILASEGVRSEFRMHAYRLSYTALLYEYENEEDEWWVKAGITPMLSYQQIKFRVDSTTTPSSYRFNLEGGIPFLGATVAAGRGPLTVTAFYGYNDDAAFNTDYDGTFHDVDIRANYYFEDQDITLFAGWRRLDLSGSKTTNGYSVESDFTISGVFLGLELTF